MKPSKKQKNASPASAQVFLMGSPGVSLNGTLLTADRFGPSQDEIARSVKTWSFNQGLQSQGRRPSLSFPGQKPRPGHFHPQSPLEGVHVARVRYQFAGQLGQRRL